MDYWDSVWLWFMQLCLVCCLVAFLTTLSDLNLLRLSLVTTLRKQKTTERGPPFPSGTPPSALDILTTTWRVPHVIAIELAAAAHRIVELWISPWHHTVVTVASVSDTQATVAASTVVVVEAAADFPNEVSSALGAVFGVAAARSTRLQAVEWLLEDGAAALEAVLDESIPLHSAVTEGTAGEIHHLRKLSAALVAALLPDNIENEGLGGARLTATLLREILAARVFLPLINVAADSDALNRAILAALTAPVSPPPPPPSPPTIPPPMMLSTKEGGEEVVEVVNTDLVVEAPSLAVPLAVAVVEEEEEKAQEVICVSESAAPVIKDNNNEEAATMISSSSREIEATCAPPLGGSPISFRSPSDLPAETAAAAAASSSSISVTTSTTSAWRMWGMPRVPQPLIARTPSKGQLLAPVSDLLSHHATSSPLPPLLLSTSVTTTTTASAVAATAIAKEMHSILEFSHDFDDEGVDKSGSEAAVLCDHGARFLAPVSVNRAAVELLFSSSSPNMMPVGVFLFRSLDILGGDSADDVVTTANTSNLFLTYINADGITQHENLKYDNVTHNVLYKNNASVSDSGKVHNFSNLSSFLRSKLDLLKIGAIVISDTPATTSTAAAAAAAEVENFVLLTKIEENLPTLRVTLEYLYSPFTASKNVVTTTSSLVATPLANKRPASWSTWMSPLVFSRLRSKTEDSVLVQSVTSSDPIEEEGSTTTTTTMLTTSTSTTTSTTIAAAAAAAAGRRIRGESDVMSNSTNGTFSLFCSTDSASSVAVEKMKEEEKNELEADTTAAEPIVNDDDDTRLSVSASASSLSVLPQVSSQNVEVSEENDDIATTTAVAAATTTTTDTGLVPRLMSAAALARTEISLYNIFYQIFSLQNRGWLLRGAAGVLRAVASLMLRGAASRALATAFDTATAPSELARILRAVRLHVLPLNAPRLKTDPQVALATAAATRVALQRALPKALITLIGREESDTAVARAFNTLQDPLRARSLVFTLLDSLIQRFCAASPVVVEACDVGGNVSGVSVGVSGVAAELTQHQKKSTPARRIATTTNAGPAGGSPNLSLPHISHASTSASGNGNGLLSRFALRMGFPTPSVVQIKHE